jgi:glutathione peroxidase
MSKRANRAIGLFGAVLLVALTASAQNAKPASSPLDYTVKSIDGKNVKLAKYRGKVVLIVNVASKCGLTPQYAGLQAAYEKYRKQGFVVLGFPANEFNGQEPGTDAEIKQFCSTTYRVTFPMFSKVVVKGDGQAPLYRFLTSKETNPDLAGDIEWNFAKFLVGRDGKVVARFRPRTAPADPALVTAIEEQLKRR